MRRQLLTAAALIASLAGAAHAQTPADTGFTYQGKLSDAGSPATGSYDLRFTLFLDDAATLPTGPVLDANGVSVNGGLFTTRLDFGAQFTGLKTWLQIEVSPAGAGTYTALPLQEITSAPQANFSLAPWATDASANISYSGGKVGIGHSPLFDFDVSASTIRLGLDANGGGQLILACNPNDNKIFMEAYNTAFNGSAAELNLTGAAGGPVPRLNLNATIASFNYGAVGIGTFSPAAKLHIFDTVSVTQTIETSGGTNAWSKTTYKNGNGSWDIGTSRGFNGDAFFIHRVGNANVTFEILPTGTTQVRTLQILGGSDLAEPFNVNGGEQIEPGMVVVIDQDKPGELCLTSTPYDTKVAGIISGANGLAPGMVMKADDADYTMGKHPVAMTGRVWCYVDASFGAIKPGDRLTTSSTPGHAMLADDTTRTSGTVIGKAMTELKEGKGLVLVLVNLQ